jgi:hypothetical protein
MVKALISFSLALVSSIGIAAAQDTQKINLRIEIRAYPCPLVVDSVREQVDRHQRKQKIRD